MTNRAIGIILVLLSAALAGHAATSRRALVIGNDTYPMAPLSNARNDATAVASVLKSLGYTTTLKLDVNRAGMEAAVDAFATSIHPGDTALLYYAGHGMQVDGENYLIPVDFSASTASQGRLAGYSLSELLHMVIMHGASTQIVILDACRDNPFLGTRSLRGGWAGVNTSAGTFIAFGTSPGSTASDSPGAGHGAFTQSLLKYLGTSQLDIEQTFQLVREDVIASTSGRQVPWTASSLIGRFHVIPALDNQHSDALSPSAQTALVARTVGFTPTGEGRYARDTGTRNMVPTSPPTGFSHSETDGVKARRSEDLDNAPMSQLQATELPYAFRSPTSAGYQGSAPQTAPRSPSAETHETTSDLRDESRTSPGRGHDQYTDQLCSQLLTHSVEDLQRARYDDAQRSLEALLALDPRTEIAARLLSLTLGRLGKTSKAIAILDRSLATFPASPALLHDRCIQESGDNPTQAIEDCGRSLELVPSYPNGHAALASAYLAADSTALARKEVLAARAAREDAALLSDLDLAIAQHATQ